MSKVFRSKFEAPKVLRRSPTGQVISTAPDPYKIKKYSHTGNKPLVESLTNPGCMVTQKVRRSQGAKRPWLVKDQSEQ
jgi:hypothetical protein